MDRLSLPLLQILPLKPFLGLKHSMHMLSCTYVFIHCDTT